MKRNFSLRVSFARLRGWAARRSLSPPLAMLLAIMATCYLDVAPVGPRANSLEKPRAMSIGLGSVAHARPPAPRPAHSPRPRPANAPAADDPPEEPGESLPAPADYHSAHFLLHSDMAPKDAKRLLARLETIQGLIARYWGRPPAGVIECFVVADLNHWPAGSLHPAGLEKIRSGGGITLTATRTLGGQKVEARATVYAVARDGVAQHESVHAYCGQTFGAGGPLWYAEGMAEMGHFWQPDDTSVKIDPHVLDYLRHAEPQSLDEIVNTNSALNMATDSWRNYAWRWALCHMLANNPNYASRFRPLGLGFLTEQDVSFEDTYGAVAKQVDFEYRFFVGHVDQGYRVDLTSWDWKKKFKPLTDAAVQVKVEARRGWQPTGATLKAGRTYEFSTTGAWQVDPAGPELSADGDARGDGRLLGVLFNDFSLGEPFDLGVSGTLSLAAEGQLYVRASKAWNKLADNKGAVTLKLRPNEKHDAKPATKSDQGASSTGKTRPPLAKLKKT